MPIIPCPNLLQQCKKYNGATTGILLYISTRLPAAPARLDDILLYDIAEEIETDEHLDRLMQTLEVSQGSQSRCHELNRLEGCLTVRGTRQMLMNWRARTAVTEQRDRLKDALTRAGLLDLRDRFFPD